jgi:Flp pilus assembly protein TadG
MGVGPMLTAIRARKGQAVLELAAVGAFLLFLAMAAVQFGILYSIKLKVTHAARAGARFASVHALDDNVDLIRQHTVAAAAQDLDLTPSMVTVTYPANGGVATAKDPAVVTVAYPCRLSVPFLGFIFGSDTVILRAQARFRIEG